MALLWPLFTCAQNRYVVNNMPGTSADFSSLQTAVNTVPAGSILYVMPSAIDYGSTIISKQLTIYGPGYFLGENDAPAQQTTEVSASVNGIWFKPGSSNSIVEGLTIKYPTAFPPVFAGVYLDSVNTVIVRRCFFTSYQSGSYDIWLRQDTNCAFHQCYFQHGLNAYGSSLFGGSNTANLRFYNNIFNFSSVSPGIAATNIIGLPMDVSFYGNTFSLNATDYWSSSSTPFNYYNNIIINLRPDINVTNPAGIGWGGNASNNISNTPNLFSAATGSNNIDNAVVDSIFQYSLPGYHSWDRKFIVRDTSFAKTWGQGSIECGAYGGINPYKPSGIPQLPYIYSMTVPADVSSGGSLRVHIKAKASN